MSDNQRLDFLVAILQTVIDIPENINRETTAKFGPPHGKFKRVIEGESAEFGVWNTPAGFIVARKNADATYNFAVCQHIEYALFHALQDASERKPVAYV